jgi:RNA polymerase sigma-70 factor (ECF subfamily)
VIEPNGDLELVTAALAGDSRGRRAIVERLLPTIRARVTCALLRYKSGALAQSVIDDLTQQVFLLLFDDGGRRLRAWEPDRGLSLTSFVGLLADREVAGTLRRGRRNPWTESPTDDAELSLRVGAEEGHEAQVASRQMLDAVLDRALVTLDERGLVLFQRLLVDEAPADVVATEMKTTVSALYMWRSRFTKMVRELGRELDDEPPPGVARPRAVPASSSSEPSSLSSSLPARSTAARESVWRSR